MRLVVFTSSFHIGASVSLARILRSQEFQVVGIVHQSVVSPSMDSIRKIQKMMKRAGVLFILKTGIVNVLQKIGIFLSRFLRPWKKRKLFDVDELARKYNIPLLVTDDVNNKETYSFVKSKKPDLLVSCYLLQILKPKMLHIPQQGAINIHPALLPKFAGSWTSFWVLFHKEKRAGATVHYMNKELDSGDIILQKSFRIKKQWSSFSCFTRKMAHFSAEVLIKALRNIKQKKVVPRKMKRPKKLFRLPTKQEVQKSRQMFRFVRFRKFFQWF